MLNVLVIGATGCIGGTFLTRLLDIPDVSLTALVRNSAKAAILRDLGLGVKIVEGSPSSDAQLLVELLQDVDVVVDAVS